MTEEKLKELQETAKVKNALGGVLENMDSIYSPGAMIVVDYTSYTAGLPVRKHVELPVRSHNDFNVAFREFIQQQYDKYKEAFDNA